MITDDLIARRPRGRTGLADWYAAVFEAQRAEGLKTTELATLLEVTATNIYYWERRLRDRDTSVRVDEAETARAGLVEECVVSPGPRGDVSLPCGSFELRLTGTRSVMVPPGFDPDALRVLVGVLEVC